MLCMPPFIIYNCESHAWPCEVERITVCVGRKTEWSQDRSLVHHRAAFTHISPPNMQDFLRKNNKINSRSTFAQKVMHVCWGGRASAELRALLRAVYFILWDANVKCNGGQNLFSLSLLFIYFFCFHGSASSSIKALGDAAAPLHSEANYFQWLCLRWLCAARAEPCLRCWKCVSVAL